VTTGMFRPATIAFKRMFMRVFTKVNGEIRVWEIDTLDPEEAINALRDELGVGHKPTILALVKY
jgi:hypothetical protein